GGRHYLSCTFILTWVQYLGLSWRLCGFHGLLQDTDVAQVAVILREIESIAYDEFVGDLETDIRHLDRALSAIGLIQQGRDAQRFGAALFQYVDQVVQRDAAVDDVFDDENVMAFNGYVEVLRHFHLAGGRLVPAVAGDAHELDTSGRFDGPRQIGEE